jgi:hypothetical protein
MKNSRALFKTSSSQSLRKEFAAEQTEERLDAARRLQLSEGVFISYNTRGISMRIAVCA